MEGFSRTSTYCVQRVRLLCIRCRLRDPLSLPRAWGIIKQIEFLGFLGIEELEVAAAVFKPIPQAPGENYWNKAKMKAFLHSRVD